MHFRGIFGHSAACIEDPWLAGADRNQVPQNESAAILASLAWAAQSKAPTGTSLVILPDASYAIGVLNADFRPKSNHSQVKVVRAVADIIGCTFQIEVQHIKSHKGHPWNELADVICEAVSDGRVNFTAGCTPPWTAYLVNPQSLEAAALDTLSSAAFPPKAQDGSRKYFEDDFVLRLPAEIIAARIDEPIEQRNIPNDPDMTLLDLKIVSYNAQGLGKAEKDVH